MARSIAPNVVIFAMVLFSTLSPSTVVCEDARQDGVDDPEGGRGEQQVLEILPGFIEGLISRDDFAGVVFFAKNDKVLFHKAYGFASRSFNVPNNLETGFNVASIGKTFTAVAIAMLVEDSLLSFDDPVDKYLGPDWISPKIASTIEIRHLLTHTSGLGNYWTDEFKASSKLAFRTLQGYKPFISDELAFEPGTARLYSNSGYVLLGAIIEKVAGVDYFQYIRMNILEPCEMTNTGFYEADRPVPNVAVGYYKDEEGILHNNLFIHPARGGPAGGMISNAPDLHKFALALLQNKLVSSSMSDTLWTPKPHSPGYGYGFGFGAGWVGHLGGFEGISDTFFFQPSTGYIIITFANTGDSEAIAVKIVRTLGEAED